MGSQHKKAKIDLKLHRQNIVLKYAISGKVRWHEERIKYDGIVNYDITNDVNSYIYWWLLFKLKPVFFGMPFSKIDFTISQDVNQGYLNIVNQVNTIIQQTNAGIAQLSQFKNATESNDRILFLNADNNYRAFALYEQMKIIDEDKILYHGFSTGWNTVERQWERIEPPWTLQELISFIIENKIKKIFSINMYFLEQYFTHFGVYLLPIFEYIGVEYIVYDIDSHNFTTSGYITRAFFNYNGFDRIAPSYQDFYFNKVFGMHNSRFCIQSQKYDSKTDFKPLNDNYGILIMSHSRLAGIKPSLAAICYILDKCKENTLFSDCRLIYFSLQYMIFNLMQLSTYERLLFNSKLGNLFVHALNFLKYEVIYKLNTNREIRIYGDEGWGIVFPEYYQNAYINEKEKKKLYKEKNFLYLMFNASLSYLAPGAPVPDAIANNAPFLNFEPLIQTPQTQKLAGLRKCGYENFSELNHKIENINKIFKDKRLLDSVNEYKRIFNNEFGNMAGSIIRNQTNKQSLDHRSHFNEMYLDLIDESKEVFAKFIDVNEVAVRQLFDTLILGAPTTFDFSSSKYYTRPYVQNILAQA